jgi:hypothetical protein
MTERRRGERHTLDQPGMATMSVVQDVEITHFDAKESVVIASRSIPRGERLLLTIPDARGGESHTCVARAVGSRVVLRALALRHEVRLLIGSRSGDVACGIDPVAPFGHPHDPVPGALSRRVPVRIVQVSYSGCLWESPSPLDEGTVGFVDLRTAGHHHTEAVRILRTMRSEETRWPYQMAVEFLTLFPVSRESLRGVAAMVAVGSPLPITS